MLSNESCWKEQSCDPSSCIREVDDDVTHGSFNKCHSHWNLGGSTPCVTLSLIGQAVSGCDDCDDVAMMHPSRNKSYV